MIDSIIDMLPLQEMDGAAIVFLMLFATAVAFVYYFLLKVLFNAPIKLKYVWPIPALMLLCVHLMFPLWAFSFFLLYFFSCLLMGTVGILYNSIKESIEKNKRKKKTKRNIKKDIIGYGTIFLAVGIFVLWGFYALAVFLVILVIKKIVTPDKRSTFLKMQSILPTSKIRSMSMGLVEVSGKVIMQEPLLSRLKKKECVGYVYTVEQITENDDGKDSYSLIRSKTVCNPFILRDDSGEVEVTGDNLDLYNLEMDIRYKRSKKRYTQYLLKNNTPVLLIGKANRKRSKIQIERETIKNIFGLMPLDKVTRWNIYKPIRTNFYIMLSVFIVVVALILMADLSIENDEVILKFGNLLDITFILEHIKGL